MTPEGSQLSSVLDDWTKIIIFLFIDKRIRILHDSLFEKGRQEMQISFT